MFEIGKKVGERNATLIGTLAHESIPILVIRNFYAHIVCVIFWNLINTVMRNNCHDFSGKNINDSIRFDYLLNLSKILSMKFQSNYYSRQYTIVNPSFSTILANNRRKLFLYTFNRYLAYKNFTD